MKTNKWSGWIAGLLVGVATVSFGQYGPNYGQAYPNGNGCSPAYPNGYNNGYNNGYGYGPNNPYGYNNGYGPSYPNGYNNGYYSYGRPYPAQPQVVIVPPRVVVAPPPPVVVAPAPVIVRPYPGYGYSYGRRSWRGGYGGRRW